MGNLIFQVQKPHSSRNTRNIKLRKLQGHVKLPRVVCTTTKIVEFAVVGSELLSMFWFGFGFRGFGQLGEGEEHTLPVPTPVQFSGSDTEKKPIIRAAPSWSYSAFVTEDGCLLLSGFVGGSPQQCLRFYGLDCQDVLPSEKYIIVLMKDRVECWNTACIDQNGTLPEPMWKMEVSTGNKSVFPLVGNGYVLLQPPFFRELPHTVQAQRIALGNEHVVLLTSDGNIMTWGAGRHGQLGHGDVEDVWEPRVVEALHGVPMKEVAAGGWHSVSISEGGDVYCWGWNESGQLGLPSRTLAQERMIIQDASAEGDDEDSEYIAVQSFPALIDLPQESEASKISCGSRHTAAVTCSGELYTWGWGRYGQLGHEDMKSLDHPTRVDFFPQKKICVIDVICRHWNTYVLCKET
ncbi:PREDICTED: RCC1 domain-containing protein 1 [Nanorana parkeri]|uniref:RCC1 domain-containing protein 1 n=1 Tax=Nanorana parkeri TaxID=125878 RepID=UPI0008549F2F|nr:PREDICTED: RCC1 domain-containing protein 1 [Nanorana parkeri]